ncbi:MAG: hypothetical protein H0T42_04585 [Deltaproteobacteria bacterium]|nr:hypothetical protein [Deltaproteobacteria bacterium]
MSLALILGTLAFGITIFGLSAVTLAERKRIPCTACRKGELKIARDFSHQCVTCGARFRPQSGKLERES